MHPIMINAFGFSIHSYGVMLAIGFMVGISLAAKEAVRTGANAEKVLNLTFWILISSILGSRLFHCIVFYPEYLQNPLRILKIWEGGLVFYGGFLGAVAASVVYTRLNKMNFWQVSDIMIPSVMLGLMFGRIGCTLAGCCFGKPCPEDFHLCITFQNALGLGIKHVPLYPTQILSAVNAFTIFLILWLYRKHKRFHGELLAVSMLVYPVTRSLIEVLRDDPRGFLRVGAVSLSESQVVSLAMIALAVYIILRVRPRQSLASSGT